MRINQFHSGTAVGDAITDQMLLIRGILRDSGFESDIYAEYIVDGLKDEIRPVTDLRSDASDILIVHHSMVVRCFEKIVAQPCKKILIYHNITPEHFFDDIGLKKCVNEGLVQTRLYRDHVDYVIADSNYNRRQLLDMGYSRVDVMPVQINVGRLKSASGSRTVQRRCSKEVNFLFVGRVVQNKRQDDVIRVFQVYNRYFNERSHLYLVGDDGNLGYVEYLKSLCRRLGVENRVTFTGKVSESDLRAYYDAADVFLCMSEHEGFGVPLLEAMSLRTPVVAYDSSAVRETMDGAGVLCSDKNYPMIAALCNELVINGDFRERLLARQDTRIEQLKKTDTRKLLLKVIGNLTSGQRKRTIQLQGPFETSYSLAIVNRKLIEAMSGLSADDDISIFATEGPGDYEPKKRDLDAVPRAAALWEKSKDVVYPDVTIRNMYPPRVRDANGGLNFLFFGWEESRIPPQYIRDFNASLDGIVTMSDYVTRTLIENGVTIPVRTIGVGVELADGFDGLESYRLMTSKRNVLLHISSAFPRKGVDALLESYYRAFTAADDVCLVLKTFPNPHNRVRELLDDLNRRYVNPPEVEWIDCDLSVKDLNRLYKAAHGYVSVARGEGFGLPVAEAMLARVPVIATPNSGMADFVNDQTAITVAFRQARAKTHLQGGDQAVSVWFEPDVDDLVAKMRFWFAERTSAAVGQKVEAAYRLISSDFTWRAVASRCREFIDEIAKNRYSPRVSMVTTWNTKCGIAEYTRMAIEYSSHNVTYRVYPNRDRNVLRADEDYVAERLWDDACMGNLKALTDRILNDSSSIVHFQFNFGFFDLDQLAESVARLRESKSVIITFHSTKDADLCRRTVSLRKIVDALNLCVAVIVHQPQDRDYLIQIGVEKERVRLLRLGQIVYPDYDSGLVAESLGITQSPVIGSYGFFLPHKGIRQVIEALPALKRKYPNLLFLPVCALHGSEGSQKYFSDCKRRVEELDLKENVRFVTDYLPNDESMTYLQACDVLIAPYLQTKESASGAVRFLLAAHKPVITTDGPIFDEFKGCTKQIPSDDVRAVATAIDGLLSSREEMADLVKASNQYLSETAWHGIAVRMRELYTEVESFRKQ